MVAYLTQDLITLSVLGKCGVLGSGRTYIVRLEGVCPYRPFTCQCFGQPGGYKKVRKKARPNLALFVLSLLSLPTLLKFRFSI